MKNITEGKIVAQGMKFAIVASRFNDFISSKLIEGALDALIRAGAREQDIRLFKCPGAFEIPLVAKKIAKTGNVASEVSKGVAQAALETEIPIVFGVLTTDSIEQAIERAGTKSGNKGWDAALAAIEMVDLFRKM
jgi:6,7-dimethyl-8-ribityllumazine synthase